MPCQSSQPPAKAAIYKAVSAHAWHAGSQHSGEMAGRGEGRGREGKEEGRGGSRDSDGEPLKSERPQQAPQGLNLHTEVCHSPVPTSLPTDKGSRAGETDAQMDGLCVRSHGVGGKEASKKGGGPGYGPWGSRTTVLML